MWTEEEHNNILVALIMEYYNIPPKINAGKYIDVNYLGGIEQFIVENHPDYKHLWS